MTKTIGCLHAHHSNIGYIGRALAGVPAELVHFVDPGLIRRIGADAGFDEAQARARVGEQLRWIAGANVDAILVTCTNYIALLDEADEASLPVPVIKLDEPFFAEACETAGPQTILFTNPATVEGTMGRLRAYAEARGLDIQAEALVVPGTFELVMRGENERYAAELSRALRELLAAPDAKPIFVAQLSMVAAAEAVERELGARIGNPLKPLAEAVRAALL